MRCPLSNASNLGVDSLDRHDCFFYQFGDFDLGGRTAISGPTSKVPPTTTRRPTQLPVI